MVIAYSVVTDHVHCQKISSKEFVIVHIQGCVGSKIFTLQLACYLMLTVVGDNKYITVKTKERQQSMKLMVKYVTRVIIELSVETNKAAARSLIYTLVCQAKYHNASQWCNTSYYSSTIGSLLTIHSLSIVSSYQIIIKAYIVVLIPLSMMLYNAIHLKMIEIVLYSHRISSYNNHHYYKFSNIDYCNTR